MKAKTKRDSKKENSIMKKVREFQLLKQLAPVFAVFVLTVLLSVLTGCGAITTSITDTEQSRTNYFSPNFTPDNKLICDKTITYYTLNALGGEDIKRTEDSIVEMNQDGTGEITIVSGIAAQIIQVSPLKTYVAVSFLNGIWVYNYSTGALVASKSLSENIKSFDWSPDETKIVLGLEFDRNVHLYDRSLNFISNVYEGASVAWKFGQKIAFYNYGFALISYDGTNYDFRTLNFEPRNYSSDGRYVFSYAGGSYRYDLNTSAGTQLGTYTPLTNQFFSPDGTKICGKRDDGGIYVGNIDGTSIVKIKD